MAKKKPANQTINEVLPAGEDAVDEAGDFDDAAMEHGTDVKTIERSLAQIDAGKGVPIEETIAALQAEIADLKATLNALEGENASLRAAVSNRDEPTADGKELAWYFDASNNTTKIAVPQAVVVAKGRAEALQKFLALSGVGSLAVQPQQEIATAEQIKEFGRK